MHQKRWQFIRVPGIVDTYYHAKYNMLTTSHNTAILSILLPYTVDRRIALLRARARVAHRKFYCRIRQMQRATRSGNVTPVFLADSIRRQGMEKGERKYDPSLVFL